MRYDTRASRERQGALARLTASLAASPDYAGHLPVPLEVIRERIPVACDRATAPLSTWRRLA
jgi:hypothetical protein